MSKSLRIVALAAAVVACSRGADRHVSAAADSAAPADTASRGTRVAGVVRHTVATLPGLPSATGGDVQPGGYGSAIAVAPGAGGSAPTIYLLTDRGPTLERRGVRLFPITGFAPHIGVFREDGDSLRRGRTIPLAFTPETLDPEGMARMADGSFWLSDESGPLLVHVDSTGRTLERRGPGTGARPLPRVLARRRENRGMEGLAATPDGRALVGMMQSPLENPTAETARRSSIARIVVVDLASGVTRQYAYALEDDLLASDVAALTDSTLLVLERDSEYPGDPDRKRRAVKQVWLATLAGATDVSDPADSPAGRRYGGRTLEEMTPLDLEQAGVAVVRKTLLLDLTTIPGGYPHDKPEGIAILDDSTIVISNDDDFGVQDVRGRFVPKTLPATGATDRGTVYEIRLGRRIR